MTCRGQLKLSVQLHRILNPAALVGAAFAAAILASGALHAASLRPADTRIAAWVSDAIEGDPRVRGSAVEVSVERGIVALDGSVASLAGRRYAVLRASTILGVLGVLDRLEVTASGRPDSEIAADVRSQLESSAAVEASALQVSCSEGRVTLSGRVDAWARVRQAELLASEVRGVREIENRLIAVPVTRRPDTAIEADVTAALARDVHLSGYSLTASVENGVVTLRGVVGSAFERERAAEEARWIPNVERVRNTIAVVWQAERSDRVAAPIPRSDDQITAAVEAAFDQDARVDASRVAIRVKNGSVWLSGSVGHPIERRILEDDARNVVGVAWVANEVHVSPESRADLTIQSDVEEAFLIDSELHTTPIQVSVDSAVVRLEGEVATRFHRVHAGNVVARIRGVKAVDNQLQIAVNSGIGDDDIAADVRTRLARNATTAGVAAEIVVTVSEGSVTLSGDVERLAERRTAADIAARSKGVRRVINHLTVDAYPYPWMNPEAVEPPQPDWRHYEIDLPFPPWVG